ncbi:zinc finger CCCH domain-containing protein 9-like [Wolffia australiana]
MSAENDLPVKEEAIECNSSADLLQSVCGAGSKSYSSASDVVSVNLVDFQRQQMLHDLQVTVDRYNDAFRYLSILIDDLAILRQENLVLKEENVELSLLFEEHLKKLQAATPSDCGLFDPRSMMLPIGAEEGVISAKDKGEASGIAPKRISIRSREYVVADHVPGSGSGVIGDLSAISDVIPLNPQPLPLGSVQVGEADGVGISVEVFNQGMAKTELCNKWEEMGWCPYGDQCQFAHGVDELRPVIRHPRYKTQLCRMVSGPGGCPYGHRCHFRHAQNTPDSQ